jgi:osmotically-inducible protein OsmY
MTKEQGPEQEYPHPEKRTSSRSYGKYHQAVVRADAEIEEDIRNSLAIDESLKTSQIDVAVHAGFVTLTGTVTSLNAKRAAADDAWAIPGVLDMKNQLKIQE